MEEKGKKPGDYAITPHVVSLYFTVAYATSNS
jgi:hypothetical protein